MRNTSNQILKLAAMAAAVLGACAPAAGSAAESWISIGAGDWSSDRRQQGQYDGMREKGFYGLFDAELSKRDDATGTWLGLRARNLGLDNRELFLQWLRQGDIGVSLEYSRISKDQPWVFNTGVQGIGTTTILVPTPSIVPGSGFNWELGTHRDRVTATFLKNLAPGLNFTASFRNEDKDGTRPWGRGGAPEFAVEPIDSTIRIGEAALAWSTGKLQLTGGYYGTWYENANTQADTALTNGTSPFFLSLPLSNHSHEIYLNGGYSFTPTLRGTFKASYSRAIQDEPLNGFGGLASPLAPTSLDGRLDTTLIELGLNARPLPELAILASLRYRDFSDKTPTRGIVFTGTTPTVFNTPFSYTNSVGKLEATYSLPNGLALMGGIEYNEQDRQVPNVGTLWVPFRATLDETTYRVEVRKTLSETVNGRLAYLYSERDGSAYRNPLNPAEPLQDLINPMNIADRKRDRWRGLVDWAPDDRLGMQFTAEASRDDYGGPNPFGLQSGSATLFAVDASYRISSDWDVYGWYSRDDTRAHEITQNSATINKYTDLTEIGHSFGAGIKGRFSPKLTIRGDVEQFRSHSTYTQVAVGGALPATQAPLPDIQNSLLRLKLQADYAIHKKADLRFSLIHEKWSTDDWTWFMFPAGAARTPWAYGTTTDGTTVLTDPKENATFFGVRYIYRFQ
jgi:MtrB/PioB family decaheme-associated outer membrane protein